MAVIRKRLGRRSDAAISLVPSKKETPALPPVGSAKTGVIQGFSLAHRPFYYKLFFSNFRMTQGTRLSASETLLHYLGTV
jgi:hypothetical protein